MVMSEKRTSETLKFLCSYNGKIVLSRHGGAGGAGKLRYAGGLTRVLAVDHSVSFAELMVKIGEFCGFSATLRCQLPDGDLETLISVTSDEDLANLVEEYDRASPAGKIRAVLSPKSVKTVSPPPSATQSLDLAPRRPHPVEPAVPAAAAGLSGGFGRPAAKSFYGPCSVREKSDRALYHHLHHYHHHHHHQGVPRSYYWQ